MGPALRHDPTERYKMSAATPEAANTETGEQTWAISLRVGSGAQVSELEIEKGWAKVDGFVLLREKTCAEAEARSDYAQLFPEGALLLRATDGAPERESVGMRWVIAVQRGDKLCADAVLKPRRWKAAGDGHTLLYTKEDFIFCTTAADDLKALSLRVKQPKLYRLYKKGKALVPSDYHATLAGIGGLYIKNDTMVRRSVGHV